MGFSAPTTPAELRFAGDTEPAERQRRIGELGLSEQRDRRIDSLSGGQRKRVSIALELLTKPSLLLLDEPTSGLDPGLEESVMRTLRNLADGGRSIIVTTHSLASLELCDRVLVLATGGRVAFYGPPGEALPYFHQSRWQAAFLALNEQHDRDWAGEFHASPCYDRYVAHVDHLDAGGRAPPRISPPPAGQSWTGQLWTLTRRYLAVIAADRYFLALMFGLPIVLGLLVISMPAPQGLAGVPGTNPQALQLLLTLVVASCLAGSANAVRELVKERKIYCRERAFGLSDTAYLSSKILVLSVITGVQTVLITVMGLAGRAKPGEGALLTAHPLLELIAAVVALAVTSMMAGLAVSAAVRTAEMTMPLLVVATMAQLVFSGALMPLGDRPLLNALSWLSPSRWALAAAASTIDLDRLRPNVPPRAPDPLWNHLAGTWVFDVVMMGVLAWSLYLLVLRRLRRLDPVVERPAAARARP